MSGGDTVPLSAGIDFGTTNSVVARADGAGQTEFVEFAAPDGITTVVRTALCFWQDEAAKGRVAHEAGPWAISEFLDFPQGSRFVQSFKSMAANATFEHANIFHQRLRFEELGETFLKHLVAHGGAPMQDLPERIVVGRPVRYVGSRPDPALARARYDAMFAVLGRPVHYVYEPMGAAYSFASGLDNAATLLVADFGGGTSDFSIVRVNRPGSARRYQPLGSAGIGIAGDRFDARIMDKVVLPLLGKGGTYRSFDKELEIPPGHFADFGDWAKLALMRNPKTLRTLTQLQHNATDPEAIGRMIAVVEQELGFGLYEAVGQLKRTLSTDEQGALDFESGDLSIHATVSRGDFESWIEEDLERIGATVDAALESAGLLTTQIDHVFLTGGSSLIPAVRRLFEQRFGDSRIASGNELTSIAHGLALIGQAPDFDDWIAPEEIAE